jgi:hypothetical protein
LLAAFAIAVLVVGYALLRYGESARMSAVFTRLQDTTAFQATSLSFIVAATQIGVELQLLTSATAAGLVGAGLLSAVLFPPIGLALLQEAKIGRAVST